MWNDDLDKLEDAIRLLAEIGRPPAFSQLKNSPGGIYQKEDAAREARSSGKKRKAGLDSGDDSKVLQH